MTLLCAETGRDIQYPTPLYAATRPDLDSFSALCTVVVERIPHHMRQLAPAETGTGGIDIHAATSGAPSPMGAYTLSGFSLGTFLFSISRETAEALLPNVTAEIA